LQKYTYLNIYIKIKNKKNKKRKKERRRTQEYFENFDKIKGKILMDS